MDRYRHTKNNGIIPVARMLPLAIIPLFVLSLLLLTAQIIHTDMGANRPPAAVTVIVTASPTALAEIWPPDNAATATAIQPQARSSTRNVITPVSGQSAPVSPPPMPPTPALPTAAPQTATPSMTVPPTEALPTIAPLTPVPPIEAPPTTVPIVPTDVPESYVPITRLLIPSIGVDAAVEVKSLETDGVMQSPGAPDIVTWYDFSSQPVDGGNAVFAGHLDYAGYGPAVFWRLNEIRLDDAIEVHQQDGTILRYRVTSVRPFAATDDASGIVASAGRPTITLITCDGAFDSEVREYDERLVVTGDRVD